MKSGSHLWERLQPRFASSYIKRFIAAKAAPTMLRAVLLALLAPNAQAVLEEVSYTATRTMRIEGREIVTQVHHAPRMERITATVAGIEVTVILRIDRNLAWQLVPLMGIYGESDISEMDTPENVHIVSREAIGVETIAGVETTKYAAQFVTRGGTRHEGFYWQDVHGVHRKTEFPYVARDGVEKWIVLELSDVELGEQPGHLFEPPLTYTRVDLDFTSLLPI